MATHGCIGVPCVICYPRYLDERKSIEENVREIIKRMLAEKEVELSGCPHKTEVSS